MITASLTDGKLVVKTAVASEGTLVCQVPGARYQRKTDSWELPLTYPAFRQLAGICGDRIMELDHEPLRDWADAQASYSRWSEVAKTAPGSSSRHGFMPHQMQGIRFLRHQRRAVLADEPGLGKTAQALMSASYPALVLCPSTVRQVWADEVAKWCQETPSTMTRVQVIGGTAAQRRKQIATPADVYVIGYESAVKHSRLAPFGSTKMTDDEKADKELNALNFNTLIVDEAHNLASPAAKRTRAAWYLAGQADKVFALTGTPLRSKPSDLWSLLHLVHADEWPVKSKFVDRYATVRFNAWGQPVEENFRPDTKAELDALVAPRFLRRTKAEVLPNMPPKVESVRRLDMANKQAAAYRQMKETMLAEVADGSLLVAPNPAQRFLRLLQIASATPLSVDEGAMEMGLPSNKADAVLDLAAERAGLPTVMFSVSRRLSRLLGVQLFKAGYSVGYVDGAAGAGERNRAVEAFQAGELDWILCTYGAGGTGITLHRADTMVRAQRPFSRVDDIQAADRIHRMGQTAESVQYIDLVSIGTAESRVLSILKDKGELMEQVCRDKDRMVELLEAK